MKLRDSHVRVRLGLLAAAGTLLLACTSSTERPAEPAELYGAEVWAQNCIRCHNLRLPDSYSDAEWQVIVHHMRVRANLTGAEQRAIVQFIKDGF